MPARRALAAMRLIFRKGWGMSAGVGERIEKRGN
jgi:hypothetical protein